MGSQFNDISGRKFGKLTAISVERRPSAPGKGYRTYWNCKCDCGGGKIVRDDSLINGRSSSCGCSVIGPASPFWRGGITKNSGGYNMIMVYDNPKSGGRYVPEHRIVMENLIGRPLEPNETVHHKNGIKTDNRPNNLELWCKQHGPGQRVDDMVSYALEILLKYKPESLK